MLLASKFSTPVYLYSMTLPEAEALIIQFKKLIYTLAKIHSREWKAGQKEIASGFISMRKMIGSNNHTLIKEIQHATGISWKTSEIVIYPCKYNGGTVMENGIYIGVGDDFERNYFNVMIHELIHLNTKEEYMRMRKLLVFPEDSMEIATTIITNKILRTLKERYNLDADYQELSLQQRKVFGRYAETIEKKTKRSKTFEGTILAVDKFLAGKVK